LGSDHNKSVKVLRNLGKIFRYYGEYEVARKYYQRVLKVNEVVFGQEHIFAANLLVNLADIDSHEEDQSRALYLCERALEIFQKVLGEDNIKSVVAINVRGDIFWHQRKFPDAIRSEYSRALRSCQTQFGNNHVL